MRRKKIKQKDLILANYTYKISVLTKEEQNWLKYGKPVEGKPGVKEPAPDWFYYFKIIDGQEVRIHKVGKHLYYNSSRLEYVDQLPHVEKHAVEMGKWKDKIAQIPDTAPRPIEDINEVEFDESMIRLEDGPLQGKIRKWSRKFAFYIEQIQEGDITVAHRYRQDKDDISKYTYMGTV